MDEREESVVFYAGDTATERIGLKLHIVWWLTKLVLVAPRSGELAPLFEDKLVEY